MTFQEKVGTQINIIRRLSNSNYDAFIDSFGEGDFRHVAAKRVASVWRSDDPHGIVEKAFYPCDTHESVLKIIQCKLDALLAASKPILGREGLFDDSIQRPEELSSHEYDLSETAESISKKYEQARTRHG
ncbi:hypothetical protein ACTJNK_13345 [Achromobacter anxifer]